jgi:hypothetical protein
MRDTMYQSYRRPPGGVAPGRANGAVLGISSKVLDTPPHPHLLGDAAHPCTLGEWLDHWVDCVHGLL